MDIIEMKYTNLCKARSDINEHLPTLYRYAKECTTILELGVRNVVSTWALLRGILHNHRVSIPRLLIVNDIEPCKIGEAQKAVQHLPVTIRPIWMDDLKMPMDFQVDLIFIDTWHVYGQLKRELEKFAPQARKYIIMHDTTTFGIKGEAVRKGNVQQMMRKSGFTREEVEKGLSFAVTEFLESHVDDWEVAEEFTNNNGLTILRRIVPQRQTESATSS